MSWKNLSTAPEIGTVLCARSDVIGAFTISVETENGKFPLILIETSVGLRAYLNACPHQHLPLDSRGPNILSSDGEELMCSNHGAHFNAQTGLCLSGDALGFSLEPVPVTLDENGLVMIG